MKPDYPGVGADGIPVRYQRETYVSMLQSGRIFLYVNLGGTAEVKLLSLFFGDEGFFLFLYLTESTTKQQFRKEAFMKIFPSPETLMEITGAYDILPVCAELYADVLTPISMIRRIAEKNSRFFLLESVEGGENWGRYSFLGCDPILHLICSDGEIRLEGVENKQLSSATPLDTVREILSKYRSPKISGMPPFTGGFVGYFAYSMIGYAEPSLKISKGQFHDLDLMLFDKVIAYDHLKQKISIIVNIKNDKLHLKQLYEDALQEINRIAKLAAGQEPLNEPADNPAIKDHPQFQCNVSKEEYCRMVEKTKEYIVDGDIFQAVISRQFVSGYSGSLLNAYRVLRTTNPSPYMVYLKIDDDEIISTSPETLVRLQEGRLTTFPVAGSRPRGRDEEEDNRLEAELLADEKELSEHNMLVDLGRNDLGKISQFGSVEVTQYKMIHKYSKIMHICSQVESEIRPGCDGCSAIEAVLPAGTLSGAPKIRACEIIEELEKVPRGIYGGALGYLDFSGNMDTCIAIRMAVKKNQKVYVQAGGGIVADSVPETEYEESANKAKAVIQAIMQAGEVDSI